MSGAVQLEADGDGHLMPSPSGVLTAEREQELLDQIAGARTVAARQKRQLERLKTAHGHQQRMLGEALMAAGPLAQQQLQQQ